MHAAMGKWCVMLALTAWLALASAVPAFAQVATGTPSTPGSVESTGPSGALVLGTGTSAMPAGGGSSSEFAEEPLPHTGGGDVAFAAASLLAAGGIGLRWIAARKG